MDGNIRGDRKKKEIREAGRRWEKSSNRKTGHNPGEGEGNRRRVTDR